MFSLFLLSEENRDLRLGKVNMIFDEKMSLRSSDPVTYLVNCVCVSRESVQKASQRSCLKESSKIKKELLQSLQYTDMEE